MSVTISQGSAPSPAQIARARATHRQSDVWTLAIGWLQQLQIWIARSGQRTALRELAEEDDHRLQDIGKSREAALREAAKPFWQP